MWRQIIHSFGNYCDRLGGRKKERKDASQKNPLTKSSTSIFPLSPYSSIRIENTRSYLGHFIWMYFIDNTSRVVSNYIQDSIRTVALLRWHDCHCEIPSQVFANYPIPAIRLYEFKQSDDDDDEAWQKDRRIDIIKCKKGGMDGERNHEPSNGKWDIAHSEKKRNRP